MSSAPPVRVMLHRRRRRMGMARPRTLEQQCPRCPRMRQVRPTRYHTTRTTRHHRRRTTVTCRPSRRRRCTGAAFPRRPTATVPTAPPHHRHRCRYRRILRLAASTTIIFLLLRRLPRTTTRTATTRLRPNTSDLTSVWVHHRLVSPPPKRSLLHNKEGKLRIERRAASINNRPEDYNNKRGHIGLCTHTPQPVRRTRRGGSRREPRGAAPVGPFNRVKSIEERRWSGMSTPPRHSPD